MLKALRAMAAAVGMSTLELRGKRLGDIARHAAGERRLRTLEAAPSLMNATVRAEMASMWIGRTQALCRVGARYAETAPRFGPILRLSTKPAEALVPAGARGLMQRLYEAGFVAAEEATAAATAASPQGATIVRILKEAPPRARRTAWSDEDARRAA
jgi:hypothetical protein